MKHNLAVLCFAAASIVFSGCQMAHKNASVDRAETNDPQMMSAYSGPPRSSSQREYAIAGLVGAGAGSVGGAIVSDRYIAVRHRLEIQTTETELPKAFEATIQFCESIKCEVLASSLTAHTRDNPASGNISLRVEPRDFAKLFSDVQKQGTMVQHVTSSEDKTSNVLDTDAKLKNRTAYRDSLRAMLGKSGAKIQDLVEIQEKLTEVQSELDGETASRKILANETEKVAVEIIFLVERPSHSGSAFAPIWNAFRDSGSNLGESVAMLIMFVVAVLPWLIALWLAIWLLKKLWRKFRKKRNLNYST